ncbi:MAG: hypothetical protein SFW67_25865 [Myxococcaceae bacterium]|nr:hypothetical protein [Myxococcaceae bacterium]
MRLALVMSLVCGAASAQDLGWPEDEFPGAIVRKPKPNLPPKKPKPVPPPGPQTRPQPVPVTPVAPRPPPPAARLPPCTLGLEVVQTVTGPGLKLEGFVVNQTSRRLTVSLLNGCPNPPMQFTGLPPGVSAFETCAMGPCVKRDPVVVTLAPRERRRLAEGFVPWEGNACSAPLPVEDFAIRGVVHLAGEAVATCERPTQKRFERVVVPPSKCPPPEPCGIHCPFGQATDANGCGLCACKPNPMELRRAE